MTSKQDRIGDIRNGLLVETAHNIAYTAWGVGVQASIFTVYNRIIVHALWCEVGETDLVGVGCLMLFNFASTVPAVGAQPLSAVCTDIDTFTRGRRISLTGTTIGTAANVDGSPGISVGPATSAILGHGPTTLGVMSVGQLGCLTSIAVLTAGTAQFGVLFTPFDPDANVVALM